MNYRPVESSSRYIVGLIELKRCQFLMQFFTFSPFTHVYCIQFFLLDVTVKPSPFTSKSGFLATPLGTKHLANSLRKSLNSAIIQPDQQFKKEKKKTSSLVTSVPFNNGVFFIHYVSVIKYGATPDVSGRVKGAEFGQRLLSLLNIQKHTGLLTT